MVFIHRYKYRSTTLFRDKAIDHGLELKDKKELTLEAEYENVKKVIDYIQIFYSLNY